MRLHNSFNKCGEKLNKQTNSKTLIHKNEVTIKYFSNDLLKFFLIHVE